MKYFTHTFSDILRKFRIFKDELAASEDKYRNFFENNPHPLPICSSNTFKIIDANRTAEKLYNYSKEEFLKLHYNKLASAKEMDLISKKCSSGSEKNIFLKNHFYRKSNGNNFYVNTVASSINYIGNDGLLMISITDVTASVEQESLLIHSNKLATLGEMASGIANEIKQPLSSIRLGVDILETLIPNYKTILKITKDLQAQVIRSDSIIKHMREFSSKFSKITLNNSFKDISFNEVAINETINSVAMLLSHQPRSTGINLKLSLTKNLPFLKEEKNRLEQVILNMLNNSKDSFSGNIK